MKACLQWNVKCFFLFHERTKKGKQSTSDNNNGDKYMQKHKYIFTKNG